MTKIHKIRWFWSWQDVKEEAWLTEMSAQGLHLTEVNNPCFYTFTQGEPENIIYKLDYQPNTAMFGHVGWYALAEESDAAKEKKQEYSQLFKDAGWQHLGKKGGWHYFGQAEAMAEIQDIYTDSTSKIMKYRRQILFQLATVGLVAYFTILQLFNSNPDAMSPSGVVYPAPTPMMQLFGLGILLLFALPILPLWWRLRKLAV